MTGWFRRALASRPCCGIPVRRPNCRPKREIAADRWNRRAAFSGSCRRASKHAPQERRPDICMPTSPATCRSSAESWKRRTGAWTGWEDLDFATGFRPANRRSCHRRRPRRCRRSCSPCRRPVAEPRAIPRRPSRPPAHAPEPVRHLADFKPGTAKFPVFHDSPCSIGLFDVE